MDENRSPDPTFEERPFTRGTEITDGSLTHGEDLQLQVNILYTTRSATLAALKVACRLGANLNIRPKVLRLYAVPFALPLEKPAVPIDFLEKQIQGLACESTTAFTARIYLCREPRRTLRELFPPRSVIVMAGKKRWWITKEQRWARSLEREGYEVIFVEC